MKTKKEPEFEIDRIKPEVADVISEAKRLVVKDHASSEQAGMILSALKAMRKKVAEVILKPAKVVKDAASRNLATLTETFDDPLEAEWLSVKRKLSAYLDEQDRLRRETENKMQAEANAAAKKQAEDQALLMEAIGEVETAEAIREAPVVVPVVHIAEVARPANVSRAANWKWRRKPDFDITKVPPEYLMLNETMLNGVAKAMKSQMSIPGLEAYDDPTIRVGG